MQARSRKLAACQTGIWNKSQLTITRDNLKIQHFGDNNVQNAIVRGQVPWYEDTPGTSFESESGRKAPAPGSWHHLKSIGSIAAYLCSE